MYNSLRFGFILLLATVFIIPIDAQSDGPRLKADSTEIGRMIMNLQYEQALQRIRNSITQAKKRKESVELLENQQSQCEVGLRMLRGADRVLVIDSVVVNKKDFLSTYPLSSEIGSFEYNNSQSTTSFTTERGTLKIISATHEGASHNKLSLFIQPREGEAFAPPIPIEGLGIDGDANYPFLMADGVTFYFAAKDHKGLGNYDLYVTRIDPSNGKFYPAENIGFPYNSYANDYLLIIDETSHLGWFASDRYQPSGKVCIYTFIPNESRRTVDYENTSSVDLQAWCSLRSITATNKFDDSEILKQAKDRLLGLRSQYSNTKQNTDFHLVIDNQRTYEFYSEFKSEEARAKCKEWVKLKANLGILKEELAKLRTEYNACSDLEKKNLKDSILGYESRIEQMTIDVIKAEKEIRKIEILHK